MIEDKGFISALHLFVSFELLLEPRGDPLGEAGVIGDHIEQPLSGSAGPATASFPLGDRDPPTQSDTLGELLLRLTEVLSQEEDVLRCPFHMRLR